MIATRPMAPRPDTTAEAETHDALETILDAVWRLDRSWPATGDPERYSDAWWRLLLDTTALGS